jgi:hypothetical protein
MNFILCLLLKFQASSYLDQELAKAFHNSFDLYCLQQVVLLLHLISCVHILARQAVTVKLVFFSHRSQNYFDRNFHFQQPHRHHQHLQAYSHSISHLNHLMVLLLFIYLHIQCPYLVLNLVISIFVYCLISAYLQ